MHGVQKMKDKGVFHSIVALAWPTILEQAMQVAVQYIDYAMVGSVGVAALAAVGVMGTMTWLVNSPLWALAAAFLACVARDVGAQDVPHARRTAAQAVTVSVAVGAVMTALFVSLSPRIPQIMGAAPEIRKSAALYFAIVCAPLMFRALLIVLGGVLRGAGDTRTPMLVNLGLNLLNIVLNCLLIYPARDVLLLGHSVHVWGANLGVAGASLATALAYVSGGVSMLLSLLRHPETSPRGMRFLPDREILKPCVRIAIPATLQRLTACLGQVTFQSMVNSLGTVAATAHATAITAESAFYIPGFGMQAAASALIGQAYGARDKARMGQLARTFLLLIVGLMSVTGALLFLLARPVMGVFTGDSAVLSLGASVLMMVAVSEPVYGVAIILEGVFYGVGDTKSPFVFEAACMWGVRILGTVLAVKVMGLGLRAAWGCMIAHNVTLAVLMAVRYRRGRWNPLNVF